MFFAESSWRKCPSNSSAGGQLEHPSEVNNSTTIALRGRPASVVLAITAIQIEITATTSIASAKIRLMRIRSTTLRFVAVFLGGGGQFEHSKIYLLVNFCAPPPPIGHFCCKQRVKCNSIRLSQGCRSPFFVSNRPRILINFFVRPDCRFYSLINSSAGSPAA